MLSVVMPVYNVDRFLREAVESILNQSFSDFEFIVVAGDKDDICLDIINSYKDDRVNIVHNPVGDNIFNWFVTSLNYGISLAKGELIARMDADDISLPDRFKCQTTLFNQFDNLVLLGCGFNYITETGITSQRRHNNRVMFARRDMHNITLPSLPHGSVMFRKEACLKVGGYRKEFIKVEDIDLWLRLAALGDIALLDELLFLYRINSISIISTIQSRTDLFVNLAHNFSQERLEKGSDPLQRGESMPAFPRPTKVFAKWQADVRNALVAKIEGNNSHAISLSIKSILLRPQAKLSWRTLAISLLGRKFGYI